jgi:hypothetical protein
LYNHLLEKNKTKMKSDEDSTNELNSEIPIEIDTHYKLYGKHMWEVNYYEKCPLCEKKIDEFGYCACNASTG